MAIFQLQPFCQQKPIVEYCNKHNIVVQAYCPLIRGAFDEPVFQAIAKNVRTFISLPVSK